ncbi:MAG: DUF4097 family beta strand repeat protein [Candidatus Zixiibacteriota bacterium]|nr:MAG: DUF4097 family beta strand repeat protein [candidate division Zixibacteria bacterium]
MRAKLRTCCSFFIPILILLSIHSLSTLTIASEEYTRTATANTSGEVEEFRLIGPTNLGGSVTLQVGDEDACNVDLECWARARNRRMAEEFTELAEMHLDAENGVVTLRLVTPRDAPWEGKDYGIRANLDIYVPPDIVVEIKTRYFDMEISGPFKTVDIRNSYGEVQVVDVTEETTIDGSYSKVEVESVQGNLEIETSYNPIWIRDVDTKEGKALLKTTYGKIDVENLIGTLDASTVYNPIHCSGLTLLGGQNHIRTVYSKIDLEIDRMEDCGLSVTNSYGNINLTVPEDLSAHLRLSVGRGGTINTNRILIRPLVLDKTRLEGICGDGDSKIGLQVNGIGKILLEGR